MTDTAQFNNSYAYIASEISNRLKQAQKPLAADNSQIERDMFNAMQLMNELHDVCECWQIYQDPAPANKLREKIINSKKTNIA